MTQRGNVGALYIGTLRVLLLLFWVSFSCRAQNGVEAEDENSARSFRLQEHTATITPYEERRGNFSNSDKRLKECVPIYIDYLSRHGTRTPTPRSLLLMRNLSLFVNRNKQFIRNSEFSWLASWQVPYPPIDEGILQPQGEEEHFHLGERWRNYFPSLLSFPYHPRVYPFESTEVPRTGRSAASFALGLFQQSYSNGDVPGQPISVSQGNFILSFELFCKKYIKETTSPNFIGVQQVKLYREKNYPLIQENVARKLGGWPQLNISFDVLDAMFEVCTFEVALENKLNGFCSLFSSTDILYIEYAYDLSDYYTWACGYPLSCQMSAPLLKDIISSITSHVSTGIAVPFARLRFAHDSTMTPLISLMGLYQDDVPLTYNVTLDFIRTRAFKTSKIVPFASNLAFILYNCSKEGPVVRVIHNEREITIPPCKDQVLCPVEKIQNYYAQYVKLDFNELCENFPASASISATSIFSIIFVWQLLFLGLGICFGGCMFGLGIGWIVLRKNQQRFPYAQQVDEQL